MKGRVGGMQHRGSGLALAVFADMRRFDKIFVLFAVLVSLEMMMTTMLLVFALRAERADQLDVQLHLVF